MYNVQSILFDAFYSKNLIRIQTKPYFSAEYWSVFSPGSGFEYFISAVISDTPDQRKFYSKEDLKAMVLNNLGLTNHDQGNLNKAKDFHKQAYDMIMTW